LQHFVTIGEVEEIEAQGVKARYEYLLRLLKQRLLTLPSGMDVVTFLRHDGKPPDTTPESRPPEIPFAQFRDGYLKTIGNGAVEKNTLYTSKIHRAHLAAVYSQSAASDQSSVSPLSLRKSRKVPCASRRQEIRRSLAMADTRPHPPLLPSHLPPAGPATVRHARLLFPIRFIKHPARAGRRLLRRTYYKGRPSGGKTNGGRPTCAGRPPESIQVTAAARPSARTGFPR